MNELDFPKNEQAFPDEFNDGMTLRDYFAAKAMPSILHYFLKVDFHLKDNSWMEGVAMDAYKMADAMLEARGE